MVEKGSLESINRERTLLELSKSMCVGGLSA